MKPKTKENKCDINIDALKDTSCKDSTTKQRFFFNTETKKVYNEHGEFIGIGELNAKGSTFSIIGIKE